MWLADYIFGVTSTIKCNKVAGERKTVQLTAARWSCFAVQSRENGWNDILTFHLNVCQYFTDGKFTFIWMIQDHDPPMRLAYFSLCGSWAEDDTNRKDCYLVSRVHARQSHGVLPDAEDQARLSPGHLLLKASFVIRGERLRWQKGELWSSAVTSRSFLHVNIEILHTSLTVSNSLMRASFWPSQRKLVRGASRGGTHNDLRVKQTKCLNIQNKGWKKLKNKTKHWINKMQPPAAGREPGGRSFNRLRIKKINHKLDTKLSF